MDRTFKVYRETVSVNTPNEMIVNINTNKILISMQNVYLVFRFFSIQNRYTGFTRTISER